MVSSSQLTHLVHLDLDLVMATVGLGKGHEKEIRSRRMTSNIELEGEIFHIFPMIFFSK